MKKNVYSSSSHRNRGADSVLKKQYKNSYIMQTLLLQAEIQEINLPIVEEFLKKIKAKKVKIKSIETLKEVVEKGRKDYKEGKTTKINPLNLWENI